jgi:hypothetical protein
MDSTFDLPAHNLPESQPRLSGPPAKRAELALPYGLGIVKSVLDPKYEDLHAYV